MKTNQVYFYTYQDYIQYFLYKSASRRLRIANGSGRSVAEVNKLRELLESQVKTMKKMSSMSETDMQRMAAQVQNGQMPGGMPKQKMGKGKGKGNFRF